MKGIGLSIPRFDAPEKVTGRTQYVADVKPARLLHARLLRSPHAHARIKRIDVSRARGAARRARGPDRGRHPGAEEEAPTRAHAVLAIDRVVFAGQPVAAVAADDLAIADEALDLIEVEYEVLPVAADPLESMQPGAPRVAEAGTEADTSEALAHSRRRRRPAEAKPAKAVNISQQARLQRGDVAPRRSPRPTWSSRRPTACRWSTRATSSRTRPWRSATSTGKLTIWASTQGSFNTRVRGRRRPRDAREPHQGHPDGVRRRLRRQDPRAVEPIAAVLAQATGRPVR